MAGYWQRLMSSISIRAHERGVIAVTIPPIKHTCQINVFYPLSHSASTRLLLINVQNTIPTSHRRSGASYEALIDGGDTKTRTDADVPSIQTRHSAGSSSLSFPTQQTPLLRQSLRLLMTSFSGSRPTSTFNTRGFQTRKT